MNLKQWLVTGVTLAIVTIFLVTMAFVAFKVGPKYEYQEAVHGHIENACSSPTPELMKENLLLSRTGMVELGLTPDMYGRLMPWKQTPEWRMDYQYARIDALVERCDEIIAWRENQDLTSGQIVDVYREKMDTLRAMIKDGTTMASSVDYLAYRAYMIENHPFLYLYIVPVLIVLSAFTLSALFNYGALDAGVSRRATKQERNEERFEESDRCPLFCLHSLIWVPSSIIGVLLVLNW
jgi:hypothetical protein